MQMFVDSRSGVYNQDVSISDASDGEARLWLKKLDGKKHTLLSLQRFDGCQLMIGGGPTWYVVTLDNGKQSLTLENKDGAEIEIIELCAGGQYGEYPMAICVGAGEAMLAISLFFNGEESQAAWV